LSSGQSSSNKTITYLGAPFLDEQAKSHEAIGELCRMVVSRKKFPFVSNALRGIVSHLTVKCGGTVHDNGIAKITASSVENSEEAPRNAADLRIDPWFSSQDKPD
jgi:hypothetical protein